MPSGAASLVQGEAMRRPSKILTAPAGPGGPESLIVSEPGETLPSGSPVVGEAPLDAPALALLYHRYAAWLRKSLSRRHGAEAAEDLVQETYLRLARFQDAREIRHPKALLSRIAANLARDQGRRRAVAARAMDAQTASQAEEPANQADQVERLLYKQVLHAMPAVYRDVYVLNRYAGMTYGQIAEHCNVSVKVVEWRMSQALAHCAKHLRD